MSGGDRRAKLLRAYERARLRRALPWAVPALLLAAAAGAWGATATALIVGPVLAVALVLARWVGGDVGRGAVAGLGAGLIPFLAVLAWGCTSSCAAPDCVTLCSVSGISTVCVLWPGLRRESRRWVGAAVGIAALTGALSCLALGTTGLLLVPAIVVPALPVAVLRPRA